MSRTVRLQPEKSLDEEYPSLSSLPKRTNINQFSSQSLPQAPNMNSPLSKSASASVYTAKKSKPAIVLSTTDQFSTFDIRDPSSFFQTELSPQDFGHALSSSLNFIPDTPYDLTDGDPQTIQHSSSNRNAANFTDSHNNENGRIKYPIHKNMKLMQPEFFHNLDIYTLFYLFYYFPGTLQQFFAAEEMKKREWIFQKKSQTWFHRIAEMIEKTSTYEISKYEYFDQNENWRIIRQQSPFKLEYDE